MGKPGHDYGRISLRERLGKLPGAVLRIDILLRRSTSSTYGCASLATGIVDRGDEILPLALHR